MTTDRRARLEALAWIFIYGGLFGIVLGVFVSRQQDGSALGLGLGVAGAVAAVTGVLMIWRRSRMDPPPVPPPGRRR